MNRLIVLLLILMPIAAFPQFHKKRAITALAGVAIRNGSSGYHVELAASRQPKNFGLGTFMGFLSIPGSKFSNWTIVGLQLKGVSSARVLRPYGLFDFGIINFQTIDDNVNMRTCSLDLGGGLEKSVRNNLSVLFDIRWKWLVDYRGEWDASRVLVVNLGLKF